MDTNTNQEGCPGCSATEYTETETSGIVRCGGCGGLYTLWHVYLGQTYRHVSNQWDDTDCPVEEWRYYDFQYLGSEGEGRRHGWFCPHNKKITQTG